MSEFVRDDKGPLDIQKRVVYKRFLRERVKHAVDSCGMKPGIGNPSNLDPMCRFPVRPIDDGNNTSNSASRFYARLRFVIALFLFFQVKTIQFLSGALCKFSYCGRLHPIRIEFELGLQRLPVVVEAPRPEEDEINRANQIKNPFPLAFEREKTKDQDGNRNGDIEPGK